MVSPSAAPVRLGTGVEAPRGGRTARGSPASAPSGAGFDADAYVLALGADSPLLMRPLGVRLPIIPVKGYSITVPKAPFPEAPTIRCWTRCASSA